MLLASFDGVGGLARRALHRGLAPAAWYGRIYAGAVGLYLAMVVCFAAAPGITVAAVALFLGGMFQAVFAVMQATLVYRSAPADMRARLLGVFSVCIGTGPIGFLYLGFLADMFTPRTALWRSRRRACSSCS